MKAPNETLFPIRELSQRCNVNTVTIRAWERRYGLLTPKRTSKGHRLYCEGDIDRILSILNWMERGVPISRVKALLDSDEQPSPQTSKDNWTQPINELIQYANVFSSTGIQSLLHTQLTNYPVHICVERLIEPVMSSLTNQTNTAGYHYLQSEIVHYVLIRTNKKPKSKTNKRLYLICGEKTAIWRLAFLAMELDSTAYSIELLNQTLTIDTWLNFANANASHECLVYQDGIWPQRDQKKIELVLPQRPNIHICGTAPMVSNINLREQFYESPKSFLHTFLNQQH